MLATMPPPTMPGSYFDRSPEDLDVSRGSFQQHNSCRKRPRLDTRNDLFTPRTFDENPLSASVSSFDIASPSPLANTEYILSGGLDTPGKWETQRYEVREVIEQEEDHRPTRFMQKQVPSYALSLANPQSTNRRDQASLPTDTISGWHLRRTAWAITGGLAGKIFNFCWNTTFSGFAAGGGRSYGIDASKTNQDDTDHSRTPTRPSAPDRDVRSQDSITKNSWVIVDQPATTDESESPVRKRPRASIASTTHHSATRPRFSVSSRADTASFASPRSRTTSFSRNHVRTNSSNNVLPHNSPSSPGANSRRSRPSLASPARRQSSYFHVSSTHASPVSPEIEQFKRQKRREAKKQDESFRKLNSQLQDMIREGQAALGSKIEVEDDQDMDEGYFEDFPG